MFFENLTPAEFEKLSKLHSQFMTEKTLNPNEEYKKESRTAIINLLYFLERFPNPKVKFNIYFLEYLIQFFEEDIKEVEVENKGYEIVPNEGETNNEKKEENKAEEGAKEEEKKEEVKQEEDKKKEEDVKKDDLKQEEDKNKEQDIKNEDVKKEDAKIEEAKKEDVKKEDVKKEDVKKEDEVKCKCIIF